MSPQQKRKLSLAVHGYGRARQDYGAATASALLEVDWKRADKFLRRAEKAKAHLVKVVVELVGGAR